MSTERVLSRRYDNLRATKVPMYAVEDAMKFQKLFLTEGSLSEEGYALQTAMQEMYAEEWMQWLYDEVGRFRSKD